MSEISSLDELFSVAKQHIIADREAAALLAKQPRRFKSKDAEAPPPDALYTNPDNWHRTRGIALIHEESQTILGNFSEYLHKSDKGARKLLREETPITVEATEVVSGEWWLSEEHEITPPEAWHTKQQAIIHLHLSKLGVHSPACEVTVHLSYGGMTRVELVVDTQFAQEDKTQEQLLFLPAGANVLPVMSQDCKINLKMELSK